MLASVCPKCGKKFKVAAVVAYPTPEQEEEGRKEGLVWNTFGLIAVDKDGNGHCSFNDGYYKSREEANEAGADMTEEDILALVHEDGYDPYYDDDYGPPDSDPYDRDGPYF